MKNIVYFEGFNGIRLIAALAVIVHHIEQIKRIYHFPNIYNVPLVKELGGMGVTLFFVLSGFLITYLLLAEKDLVKTIYVRKFYIFIFHGYKTKSFLTYFITILYHDTVTNN